jgi:hypothetical protein
MKSKRATKETGTRISCIATAMHANTHEIRSLASGTPITRRTGQCHPRAFCVKCHLCCHTIAGMSLDTIKVKRRLCSRIRGTAIA